MTRRLAQLAWLEDSQNSWPRRKLFKYIIVMFLVSNHELLDFVSWQIHKLCVSAIRAIILQRGCISHCVFCSVVAANSKCFNHCKPRLVAWLRSVTQKQTPAELTLCDRMADISAMKTINQILLSGFSNRSSQTSHAKAISVAILDFIWHLSRNANNFFGMSSHEVRLLL